MPYFTKDSLYPDSFLASDEAGNRVKVEFTSDDVQYHYDRVKELLAAGLKIPLCLEHQSKAKPMTLEELEEKLAEKTRSIIGYAEDALLDSSNRLYFLVNVPDEADAKKATTIRYVSPEFKPDFVDGKNRSWPGQSITHLALTGCPVQLDQDGFRPVRMSLSNCPGTIRLSIGANMADNEKEYDEETGSEPETDEGDEGLDLGEDEGQGEGEELFTEEPAAPPVPEEPVTPPMDAAAQTLIPELKNIFSSPPFNIVFPDMVNTTQSFLEHLLTGMMTSKAHLAASEMNDEPEPTPEGEDANMATANNNGLEEVPNQSVLMSLQSENKALKEQLHKQESYIARRERDSLQARINKLCKVCPESLAKELKGGLSTVRLSVGTDGQVDGGAFLAKVEMAEKIYFSPEEIARRKREKAWREHDNSAVRLSLDDGVTEEQPPRKPDGSQLVPEVMGRLTGGLWKPKS